MFFKKLREMLTKKMSVSNVKLERIGSKLNKLDRLRSIEKRMESMDKSLIGIHVGLMDLRDVGRYFEEKRRIQTDGEYHEKAALRDAVARAKDIWGLDYADSTGGLYPSGNQIGRRPIAPQDVGLSSWLVDYLERGHDDSSGRLIDCVTSEHAVIVMEGFYIRNPPQDFMGFDMALAEVPLPYVPWGPSWKYDGVGYRYICDAPAVLMPDQKLDITAHFLRNCPDMEFSLIGQVVAKAQYLRTVPKLGEDPEEKKDAVS